MKGIVPPVVLLVAACSSGGARVTLTQTPERLVGLAVTPLIIHDRSDDFETAKRTLDVLDTLWTGSDWLLIGPDDFRAPRHGERDFLRGSDLVLVARRIGIDPHRLAVLEGSVTTRQAHGEAHVSGGESGVGRDFSGEASITLSLYGIEGALLADVAMAVPLDPLAERPEWDSRPELRAGLTEAVRGLIEACGGCFLPSWRPAFTLRASPALLLGARDPSGRALRERIAVAGVLEKDQLLWTNLMYADPAIAFPAAKRMLKTPSGACAGDDAPAPLAPGDCLVSLDGAPLTGPHVLGQHLRAGGKVELSVVSPAGEARNVTFP